MQANHAARVTVSLLFGALTVSAHAEPMKELAVYKNGLGKWTCDAKEVGSGKAFKAAVEFSVEFDGNTYVERYTEVATPDRPSPWKGIFLMSYDPQSQRWVRNGIDNAGMRNAASSSGWNDNTWVWENDYANIVINQSSPKARTIAIDVKEAAGVKRVVEGTCKRI